MYKRQIGHRVYRIAEAEDIAAIEEAFAKIKEIYIADGHHRAASAVKVGLMRRAEPVSYTHLDVYKRQIPQSVWH